MLKRFQMYGSHVGVIEEECEQGSWVSAEDAQAQTNQFLAWLDGELREGTCPEFLAAIRKVR